MKSSSFTAIKYLNSYSHPKVFSLLFLGFSSGLPFLLTVFTLPFWLSEVGVSKTIIGFFLSLSFPYSVKFLWAPFLDYLKIPYLSQWFGQRRSWALTAQVGLIISLYMLGHSDPVEHLGITAFWTLATSFFAASQDIIIDAFRIETLKGEQRGPGAAMETIGFRLGMLTSGAGALYLAAFSNWQLAYTIMACLVSIGMLTMLFLPEPTHPRQTKPLTSLRQWFIEPWLDFSYRHHLVLLAGFIFFFKAPDAVISSMMGPFLYDLGVSKIEFANISKLYGISLMVIGGLTCGILIQRSGMFKILVLCILIQTVGSFCFVLQSLIGNDITMLIISVGIESFASGMAATAFIAYLSSYCEQPHTATHFTLLYSCGSLTRVLVSSASGAFVEWFSWASLFMVTVFCIVPALFLLKRLHKARS